MDGAASIPLCPVKPISRPLDLLIISQYFWPENFRINDLAAGMRDRGHNVTVLTGIPNYPGGRFYQGYGLFRRRHESYRGVEIVRVPLIPRGGAGGFRLVLNYLSYALCASIAALWFPRRYDLIFVYEPSPITVGLPALAFRRLKGTPVIFWVLDLWPESLAAATSIKSKWVLNAVGKLVRFIYRRCDRLLVQSRAFVPEVVARGASPEKVKYFPSWGEDLYRPLASEEIEGLPVLPQGIRVMFAGNIGAAQDFETILDAAELLKSRTDVHWLILGEGRMSQWVRSEVAKRGLGGQVHLLGQYPAERMPAFFSAADIMLVSLKRAPIFALTIPAKVQSYLACGRPILAMLDGEGARIVEEAGAGLVSPTEDAAALARNVLQIAAMPRDEREAMGRRGRDYYEKCFERKMLFDRLETWMHEMTEKNRL